MTTISNRTVPVEDANEPSPNDAGVESLTARHQRRALLRRVVARLLGGVVVLWGAVTLTFFGLLLAPGDTASLLAGATATAEQRDLISEQWGLDRPWWQQYFSYLGRLLHGDFGISYSQGVPVSYVLQDKLVPTFQLAFLALGTAIVITLIVGTLVGSAHRSIRVLGDGIELVLASIPTFWLGILLLFAFSFHFRIFPVSGNDGPLALVLPTLTLALPIAATLNQVFRGELDRVREQPFYLTARARGLSVLGVQLRHGVRHAISPVVTLSGIILGSLLGGTIIVEQVFGRTGIGQVTIKAVTVQDIPVAIAIAILSAVAFVLTSTIVDILYSIIDPRLREG